MDPETHSATSGRGDMRGASAPPPRAHRRGGCGRAVFFLGLCVLMLIPVLAYLFPDFPGKMKRGIVDIIRATREQPPPVTKTIEKIVEVPVEVEKIVEVPAPPPPLPDNYVTGRNIDVAELYNGFQIKTILDREKGRNASVEREDPEGYQIQFQVSVKVPKASETLEEFTRLNPALPKILPDFGKLLENGGISKFYHELYRLKGERVQQHLTRMRNIPSRHNYYDCESVLELQHPDTMKRVLLIQGEMDVVSDGTDGDRLPEISSHIADSTYFQPITSYGWPKRTKTPNPLLARWQENLKKAEEEYKVKGLSAERNRYLVDLIAQLKREIADMKARSFLIGEKDPFIVIPVSFLGRAKENPCAPEIGDYAVVIHGDKAYPAIAGDAGPTYKVGEASLRMAKELNDKAGVYSRPESDLKVTYLVFPGSADAERGPPDLDRWHARCLELIEGIGGLGEGTELHRWADLFKKEEPAPPPPAPAPEPSPSPAPEPGTGVAPTPAPVPDPGTGAVPAPAAAAEAGAAPKAP